MSTKLIPLPVLFTPTHREHTNFPLTFAHSRQSPPKRRCVDIDQVNGLEERLDKIERAISLVARQMAIEYAMTPDRSRRASLDRSTW